MFEKRISADAWKEDLWGEETPRAAIIRTSSRGITGMDKVAFEKRAMAASAELLDKVDKLPTNPGEVLVHMIALGTTEAYGPNRNGDGFSKAACIKYHPSFVSDARVYRNHKNKDTAKSYGIVKASAYNDQMSRIELIVGLNGTKEAADRNGGEVADKELEKLESGDFPVSMSCRVPYDVCSYCGNKATSPDKYCKGTDEGGHCKAGGLQHRMGKLVTVDNKLHTLFADNTEPHFFDISHVIVPADRIAYTSGKLTKSAEYLEDAYYKTASILPQTIGFRRCKLLADSVVNYHNNRRWEKVAMALPYISTKMLTRLPVAGQYKFASVMRAMTGAGVCLTAPQFLQLTTGTDEQSARQLGEIIAPLSNEQYTKLASVNPYTPATSTCERLRDWVISQELPSIFGNDWCKQAALATLTPLPPPHFSLDYIYGLADDPQIEKLAKHFAMYKAAFVEALPKNIQEFAAKVLVERDYARL